MTQPSHSYEPPFVLAIDVGSSSVRASLFDARAQAVAGADAREAHLLHTAPDGTAEDRADHLLQRVNRVIDNALRAAGPLAREIKAVGVDILASTLLGVDEAGRPLTPVYTYADTRPGPEVEYLRQHLDVAAAHQRTGCPQHTSYAPARFLWVRRTYPDLARRVHRWMDAGTFLYTKWFGHADIPISYSIASWLGLLNRHKMQWDEELLDRLEVSPEQLPLLADYTDAHRGLASSFAKHWPPLRDVPFFLTVGDGAAANVGSGCLGPGRAALTIGTSGAMRVLLSEKTPAVPPGLWAYRLGRAQTLLGGSFNEGGNVLVWASDTLQLPPLDRIDQPLSLLPPDGHGLTALPFLAGERSPGWTTRSTGVIMGLQTLTTPLQVLQALLEAVSYRFGMVWELLAPFAQENPQIIASGGAITRSTYWLQLMADVLQRPVMIADDDETTSRGTAILALHGLGVWPTLDAIPARLGAAYEPDSRRSPVYQAAMQRQQLYEVLVGHSQRTKDEGR
jgi:gluconokinase